MRTPTTTQNGATSANITQREKELSFSAVCQRPPTADGKSPAIVLLHDRWGRDRYMAWQVERVSDALHVIATAPDLFGGVLPTDEAAATEFAATFKRQEALDGIAAAVSELRSHPLCNGQVALIGFGLGGTLAIEFASRTADVTAVVSFYGAPDEAPAQWISNGALLLNVVSGDTLATEKAANRVCEKLVPQGIVAETRVYAGDNLNPARHGFVDDSRGTHHPAAANEAWLNTVTFLRTHLRVDADGGPTRQLNDAHVERYATISSPS